jgi:LysR family glycine cleavage system transcriptional activator
VLSRDARGRSASTAQLPNGCAVQISLSGSGVANEFCSIWGERCSLVCRRGAPCGDRRIPLSTANKGIPLRHRLPPLNTLRLFEASARLLSFKNAAEELSVTPSAVSHGIQTLEQWLGVPLFVRTRRSLVLSDAGAAYYPVVQEALALLSRGSERLAARHGARRLAVSAAPTFAARWLLPRLPQFRERHPEIAVVIDTVQERVDLQSRSVDLAVRMGRGGWQGLFAERILTEQLVPVCSPTLRERVGDIADIVAAPLIHVMRVSEEWTAWAEAAGREPPDPAHGLRFDTLQMAFDAAAAGLGVAMGRKPLVDADLNSGRLVIAWEPVIESATSYWLVGLEARADEPDIQAFRAWVISQRDGQS